MRLARVRIEKAMKEDRKNKALYERLLADVKHIRSILSTAQVLLELETTKRDDLLKKKLSGYDYASKIYLFRPGLKKMKHRK